LVRPPAPIGFDAALVLLCGGETRRGRLPRSNFRWASRYYPSDAQVSQVPLGIIQYLGNEHASQELRVTRDSIAQVGVIPNSLEHSTKGLTRSIRTTLEMDDCSYISMRALREKPYSCFATRNHTTFHQGLQNRSGGEVCEGNGRQ
jgi:hypothetical protein